MLTGGTDAGSWHWQWQHWATTAGSGGCAAVIYAWWVPQTQDLPIASTLGSPRSFLPSQTPAVGVPRSYSPLPHFGGTHCPFAHTLGTSPCLLAAFLSSFCFQGPPTPHFHLKISLGVPITSSILSWGHTSFGAPTVLGIPPVLPHHFRSPSLPSPTILLFLGPCPHPILRVLPILGFCLQHFGLSHVVVQSSEVQAQVLHAVRRSPALEELILDNVGLNAYAWGRFLWDLGCAP